MCVVAGLGRGVVKGTVDGVDVSVMGLREGVLQGEASAEERWVGESQGV